MCGIFCIDTWKYSFYIIPLNRGLLQVEKCFMEYTSGSFGLGTETMENRISWIGPRYISASATAKRVAGVWWRIILWEWIWRWSVLFHGRWQGVYDVCRNCGFWRHAGRRTETGSLSACGPWRRAMWNGLAAGWAMMYKMSIQQRGQGLEWWRMKSWSSVGMG